MGPTGRLPDSMTTARRLVLTLLVLAAGSAMLWAWGLGQPRAVGDPAVSRIGCLSYAAFRMPGESPLDPSQTVSEVRLEADLRFLASHTNCVRSYSVGQGMDALPRVAQRLGMQVLLGIWIGRDNRLNEKEIALGIATARAYPDTVRAVMVGNEVLLRGEQPESALAAYILRVRAEVAQPVTYADVWDFWLRHPRLAEAASFVTVHILPFWEDSPVPIEHAVEHVLSIYDKVKARFPQHDVLIGETGWPSVGRDRHGAVPSRENAARFVRGVVSAAEHRGIRYNVVEAFDQPWKRQLEGAVGGYWGIFASDGSAKFPLHGPVIEEPRWVWGIGCAVAVGLLFLLTGTRLDPRIGRAGSLFLFLTGIGAGFALAAQARTMWLTCRSPFEYSVSTCFAVMSLAACWLLALSLSRWLSGGEAARIPAAVRIRDGDTAGGLLAVVRLVLLFGTAATNLLLAFDPRYRDFPIEWLIVPALGFALLAIVGPSKSREDDAREEWLLALVIVAMLPAIMAIERLANLHALAWVALCALLALSVGLPWKGGATPRANQHQ
ncbi:MAG: glycoside hydrolase family 17 [Sterolibacteriaceae bacterium]|nr:glycoside hydrolase family 17 [Sterolibacteriaceae bacterium]